MGSDIPLTWFLLFAAAFSIGVSGVLMSRAIAVLMAVEIMLNTANINLVAFWRYGRAAGGRADQRHHPGHLRAHSRGVRGCCRYRIDFAVLSPLALLRC